MKKENQIVGNEVSVKEQNQIILYRPNDTISLEVRLENDTVWLTQEMMSDLFQRNKSTISRHVKNIFQEKELLEESVVAKFATTASDSKIYQVDYYNLDVVISVGYRVKSIRGTQFRQWANKVLKEYLLRGHALNYKFELIEEQLKEHKAILDKHEDKIDFFVRTSLPPVEGIFCNGQIFDAYKFATDLIKSAKKSLVLIDNYVDESVLLMLSKREAGVSAKIYTSNLSKQLTLDLAKHNKQYPPIEIFMHTTSHDRFLIIDDAEVYHIGASLKDLGKKLFAFSKLNIEPSAIL